jgi:hypothetical protein
MVGVVAATFPYGFEPVAMFGARLTNWLTVWFFNLAVIAVCSGAVALAFFGLRGIVAYIEEGRWPRKAAGVEVAEVDGALDQIERDADNMSASATTIHKLEKQLEQSNALIRYLWGELERARGAAPPQQADGDTAEENRRS